jgi:catechol 2,3-dioxygenase-like lactoylglutathione lyase family enzyme
MQLTSLRIITETIQPLVQFYEAITGIKAVVYTPDFAEIKTPMATLAIGSVNTLALFGGTDMAQPALNRSVIIEFSVADVDAKYQEIAGVIKDNLVQVPTTMPWGNRSLLFRDPDGNLVNFFTPRQQ